MKLTVDTPNPRHLPLLWFLLLTGCEDCGSNRETGTPFEVCEEETLDAQYERYVEPFVSGTVRSSCTDCHLTGVDIGMYAQDTPCQTLACMVDAGVVDLEHPAESLILSHILMGDPSSSIFDVEEEYSAFMNWISWSAECHSEVCPDLDSPCDAGTGATSTGIDPLGDCSEDDLLAVFWDSVIIDRGRCTGCHTQWAAEIDYGTCTTDADCDEDRQECIDGLCRKSAAFAAPHFFGGGEDALDWTDADDRDLGRNSLYDILALGLLDTDSPLDSLLLTKPLLEDFEPLAIYGPGLEIPTIDSGTGMGVGHGGSSKFHFSCREPPCPDTGVVDCRVDHPCETDDDCTADQHCLDDYCRLADSVCDETYVAYVQFALYYAECRNQP